MKKVAKFIILPLVILCAIGYGVYHYGTNIASEKIMDKVTTDLENSGEIEEVKQAIENDPEIKKLITVSEKNIPANNNTVNDTEKASKQAPAETKTDVNSVDESNLPFTTKEEAARVVIKKVGISKLNEIRADVQEGNISKEEVMQELQSKLSEEEITALKVIAYKEMSKGKGAE